MAKSLFEGMLKSAVNQFARDSGKVLSNTIYGDAHSTPIRRVSCTDNVGGYFSSNSGEEVTEEEMRQWCKENGMKFKISRTEVWQVVGIALIGAIPILVTGIVAGPAFLFAAIRRIWYFFTADAIYVKRAMVANKIPDRRYSRGYRIEGFRKGYEIVAIPPTLKERSYHLLFALLYAIIGIGILLWNYFGFEYISSMDSPQQQ